MAIQFTALAAIGFLLLTRANVAVECEPLFLALDFVLGLEIDASTALSIFCYLLYCARLLYFWQT